MKDFDFVKIGSACFDPIALHCGAESVGLIIDDNEEALQVASDKANLTRLKLNLADESDKTVVDLLKEYQVRNISILKISLGRYSCKALLCVFKYLRDEAVGEEYRPSQISFGYSAGSTAVDDFFAALKEAIQLGYTVDGQDGDHMILNYAGY